MAPANWTRGAHHLHEHSARRHVLRQRLQFRRCPAVRAEPMFCRVHRVHGARLAASGGSASADCSSRNVSVHGALRMVAGCAGVHREVRLHSWRGGMSSMYVATLRQRGDVARGRQIGAQPGCSAPPTRHLLHHLPTPGKASLTCALVHRQSCSVEAQAALQLMGSYLCSVRVGSPG